MSGLLSWKRCKLRMQPACPKCPIRRDRIGPVNCYYFRKSCRRQPKLYSSSFILEIRRCHCGDCISNNHADVCVIALHL